MKVHNMRYLRIKHDLTQAELAKKIGCTDQYVSDIETGKSPASEKFLIKAADVFGVRVSELVGEKIV